MTAQTTIDQSVEADRCNVLSHDEESTLCLVRQIVAGARAQGIAEGFQAVVREVIEAGASRQFDAVGRESSTFKLKGAYFSLTFYTLPEMGIEINFSPGEI